MNTRYLQYQYIRDNSDKLYKSLIVLSSNLCSDTSKLASSVTSSSTCNHTRDGNTRRGRLPVRVCAWYLLFTNIYWPCCCSSRKQMPDWSKTCLTAVFIRSHCAEKIILALKHSRNFSRATRKNLQDSKTCFTTGWATCKIAVAVLNTYQRVFNSQFRHFQSRKCISNCRLQNFTNFVSTTMCY